jgi:hypothetical protein
MQRVQLRNGAMAGTNCVAVMDTRMKHPINETIREVVDFVNKKRESISPICRMAKGLRSKPFAVQHS